MFAMFLRCMAESKKQDETLALHTKFHEILIDNKSFE